MGSGAVASGAEKKKRGPVFSAEDVDFLCGIVLQHPIITSKSNDNATRKQKLQEWIDVASEYNSQRFVSLFYLLLFM